MPHPPVVINTNRTDPATIERAAGILIRSHTIEHQAVAAIRAGDTTEAKMLLQRQIQALVTVLALL